MKKHSIADPFSVFGISSFAMSVSVLWFAFTASAAAVKVLMGAAQWQTETGAFEKIQGFDALALHDGTSAIAKSATLGDGTIEFDVQPLTMGAGLAFRRRDERTFESFYMRPDGQCASNPKCLQYAPQKLCCPVNA